jgi:hypothetical protein
MSRAEWIVCERTNRWAAALRLALTQDDPAPRLCELRHLSELDSEVAARPAAIVAIEVHRGNFAAVLQWLSRSHVRRRLTRCAALLDRSLASDSESVVGPLLEAGAVAIAPSPRRLDDVLALERFQTQIAGISGSRESLLDQLRASLPWQAT